MKIVMLDGRTFEGTPLEIVHQMRDLALVEGAISPDAYIDWVVANAKRCFEVELVVRPDPLRRRCADLLLALLRTELAFDAHTLGWSEGDDAWFWEILDSARGPEFLRVLERELHGFAPSALQRFDHGFRRKVYLLDREDIARASTLGGGVFVHARAHNVALGRAHFEAVQEDPQRFVRGALCGVFALAPALFGPGFPPRIPILTGSNPLGWPEKLEW